MRIAVLLRIHPDQVRDMTPDLYNSILREAQNG